MRLALGAAAGSRRAAAGVLAALRHRAHAAERAARVNAAHGGHPRARDGTSRRRALVLAAADALAAAGGRGVHELRPPRPQLSHDAGACTAAALWRRTTHADVPRAAALGRRGPDRLLRVPGVQAQVVCAHMTAGRGPPSPASAPHGRGGPRRLAAWTLACIRCLVPPHRRPKRSPKQQCTLNASLGASACEVPHALRRQHRIRPEPLLGAGLRRCAAAAAEPLQRRGAATEVLLHGSDVLAAAGVRTPRHRSAQQTAAFEVCAHLLRYGPRSPACLGSGPSALMSGGRMGPRVIANGNNAPHRPTTASAAPSATLPRGAMPAQQEHRQECTSRAGTAVCCAARTNRQGWGGRGRRVSCAVRASHPERAANARQKTARLRVANSSVRVSLAASISRSPVPEPLRWVPRQAADRHNEHRQGHERGTRHQPRP